MSNSSGLEVNRLWAVDLDRTTLDSTKLLSEFINLATDNGLINESSVESAQRETEETGGSFDVIQYLRGQGLNDTELLELVDAFTSQPDTNLLYNDALPFLEKIDSQTDHIAMLLTYGSTQWQTAKLLAAGLGAHPYIITDERMKGYLISEWKVADTRYKTMTASGAIVIANTVTLVDDKARSFSGLPDDCEGYLIRRPGVRVLRSQIGHVPDNTKIVNSLLDIPVT